MLVRATRPVRLECVVRGYLFGGGWKEYQEQGTVGGFPVPAGLQQAERLPEPLFTPTTKAESGPRPAAHRRRGDRRSSAPTVYEQLRDLSLAALRVRRAARAHECGLILADTKFEFGELDGEILVIDEMMTPDSSRYWPAEAVPRRRRRRRRSTSSTCATSWTAPAGITSRPRRTCRPT